MLAARHALLALLLSAFTGGASTSDEVLIRVVDARTGVPIEGATIFVPYRLDDVLVPLGRWAPNESPCATTDARGCAWIPQGDLIWLGDVALLVTAPRHESALVPFGDEEAAAADLGVVSLRALRRVSGQLLEADGSPGRGDLEVVFTIWKVNPDRASAFSPREFSSHGEPIRIVSVGANGRFAFDFVPPGDLVTAHVRDRLTGFAGERTRLPSEGPIEPIVLNLPERALVRVRLSRGEGEVAIERSDTWDCERVTALRGPGWTLRSRMRVDSRASTDVARLLPGHVRLGLSFGSDVWSFRRVALEPGATHDVILDRSPLKNIRVRVVDPSGAPLPGISTNFYAEPTDGISQGTYGETDGDGRCVIDHVASDLPPGQLRLRSRWGPSSLHAVVDGVRPGADIEVEMAPGRTAGLDLRVRGGVGEDVATTLVRHDARDPLVDCASTGWRPLQLGPVVDVSEHGLEAGCYYLLVQTEHPADWAAERLMLVLAPGQNTELTLDLEPTAVLELQPPPGALAPAAVTLRRGGVAFEHLTQNPVVPVGLALPPGPLTVEWRWPDGTGASRTVIVRRDRRTSLLLSHE